MSKIGKKPITIKEGVSVALADGQILVKGPKGETSIKQIPFIDVEINDNQVNVSLLKNIKQGRSNWGTMASLINNAVTGVSDGFSKTLEINGVGFKAAVEGKDLVLNVGFSHPIRFPIPDNTNITVEKNIITVSGHDKDLVGRTASDIRAVKKPEPYKGKGIKYTDEIIRRKAGKKVSG